MKTTPRIWRVTASSRAGKSRRGGQALVEFGLLVLLLVTMLMGIIEFGWLIRNELVLTNATREGARVATVGGTTDAIRTRILKTARPPLQDGSTITIEYAPQPTGTAAAVFVGYTSASDVAGPPPHNTIPANNLIRITSTATHKQLTGFFPFLRNKTLLSAVVMPRENN